MKRGLLSTTGLVLGLALFAVVNLFTGTAVRAARIDLTENGLFTLSDGTKSILSKLDQKLRLRYYFSKETVTSNPDVAPLADYAKRVQELLEEYVALSAGQVSLEVVDPTPFSEEEDDAVAYGLSSPPINAAGDRLFFGLVATNSVDDQRAVPFFDQRREEFLEYDLTEIISDLARIEKPVIGVISGLPVHGSFQGPNAPPAPPWFAIEQLQRGFETRELAPESTKEIPAEVQVLVIIHPKGLAPELLYAIDQFALKGGKVIVFVDPHAFFDQSAPPGGNPMMAEKDSNLKELFDAWGLELVERKIAADNKNGQMIGQGERFIAFLGLQDDCLSQTDVVTGDLKYVHLLTPGILRKKDGATTNFETLIQSSEDSQEIDVMSVQFGPNPKALLDSFIAGNSRLTLAARISGPAKSAFPNGKPAAPEDKPADSEADPFDPAADPLDPDADPAAEEPAVDPATHVAEAESIHAIVVADTDFLYDDLWVQKSNFFGQTVAQVRADNGSFLINAVENMTGDADLISLRSRGRSQRPFDRKDELAREADERYRAREQELEANLRETESQLAELQQKKSADEQFILTTEQEAAIQRFEDERLATRKDLRKVRHDLRKDIDSLGGWLKFVNIGMVPAVITLLGLAWLSSQNRMRRKAS